MCINLQMENDKIISNDEKIFFLFHIFIPWKWIILISRKDPKIQTPIWNFDLGLFELEFETDNIHYHSYLIDIATAVIKLGLGC